MKVHDGAIIIDTTLDIEGLKKEIANLYQTVKKFTAEFEGKFGTMDKAMEKTTATAKKLKIEPTTEGIEAAVAELDTLNAKIDVQRGILDEHRSQLDRVNKTYGETSTQALNLQKKVLNAESAIQKMSKQSDTLAGNIRDAEEAMKDGAEAAGDLGDKSKKSKKGMEDGAKGAGAFQFALGNLIAKGIEKAISATIDLIDRTKELRHDMSKLEQNARSAGVSMEVVNSAMRTMYAITGEMDSSVEAVSNLLAADFDGSNLQSVVEALSGAVVQFPDTLKIESLADSLQETLATGEATGQFAELLGRVGVNVDNFEKGLDRASRAGREQEYIMSTLAKAGLTDVYEQYKKNNKGLLENRDAQYDLNAAYATFAEVLEPIQTQILTSLTKLLTENQDIIKGVIKVVGEVIKTVINVVNTLSNVPTPLLLIGAAITGIVFAIAKFTIGTYAASIAISASTKTLAAAAPAAITAGAAFAQLAAQITMVSLAIAAVTLGVAALISAINGVPMVMVNSNITNMPKGANVGGYARGTASARRGWNWVDENHSPALLYFNGGEKVFTASQSMAMRGMGQISPTVVNENYYVTIDGRTVQAFNDVIRIAQGQKQSQRMGYVGK